MKDEELKAKDEMLATRDAVRVASPKASNHRGLRWAESSLEKPPVLLPRPLLSPLPPSLTLRASVAQVRLAPHVLRDERTDDRRQPLE